MMYGEKIMRGLAAIAFALLGDFNANAQEQIGGESLLSGFYNDSLTINCKKTADGCYHKDLSLPVNIGTRLSIYYQALDKDQQDLALTITNGLGNHVKKTSEILENQRSSIIHLDTIFYALDILSIKFTTCKPGETFRFNAIVFIGSPEAVAYQKDADLCWKLGYFFKHSDNGFNFIKSKPSYFSILSDINTIAPLFDDCPACSSIHSEDHRIFYSTNLGNDSPEAVLIAFQQFETALKRCMGDKFEYTTSENKIGLKSLVCTYYAGKNEQPVFMHTSAPVPAKNDKLAKYVVTLFMEDLTYAGLGKKGAPVWELNLRIENLFYQDK
jgi:hypothetical protein